jgi:hypothetical protein
VAVFVCIEIDEQRLANVRFTPSLEVTVTPIKDETGKLVGMAAVMRDVTKQFQEMRALKRKLDER